MSYRRIGIGIFNHLFRGGKSCYLNLHAVRKFTEDDDKPNKILGFGEIAKVGLELWNKNPNSSMEAKKIKKECFGDFLDLARFSLLHSYLDLIIARSRNPNASQAHTSSAQYVQRVEQMQQKFKKLKNKIKKI